MFKLKTKQNKTVLGLLALLLPLRIHAHTSVLRLRCRRVRPPRRRTHTAGRAQTLSSLYTLATRNADEESGTCYKPFRNMHGVFYRIKQRQTQSERKTWNIHNYSGNINSLLLISENSSETKYDCNSGDPNTEPTAGKGRTSPMKP